MPATVQYIVYVVHKDGYVDDRGCVRCSRLGAQVHSAEAEGQEGEAGRHSMTLREVWRVISAQLQDLRQAQKAMDAKLDRLLARRSRHAWRLNANSRLGS
jgi:hypothetical protein